MRLRSSGGSDVEKMAELADSVVVTRREKQDGNGHARGGDRQPAALLARPLVQLPTLGTGVSVRHLVHQCDRLVHPGAAAAEAPGLVSAARHRLLRRLYD